MIGAKFINTRMEAAKFIESNLTDALFQESNRAGLSFHNAVLIRSHFTEPPQNMKFMNTDLYGNDWKNEDIVNHTFSQQTNTVINTRFSNSTFSEIDSKQLVIDGGAERVVRKNIAFHTFLTKSIERFLG
ncbi:unnamed protein product [Rotaria sp. Silwood1]|nr:unnamed protein product [Rotaria sp. Silwood1]